MRAGSQIRVGWQALDLLPSASLAQAADRRGHSTDFPSTLPRVQDTRIQVATACQNLAETVGSQARAGAPLFASTVLAGLFSYFTLTVSARLLGSADFGLLSALVAAASLVVVALRPLHTAATYLAAAAVGRGEGQTIAGLAGRALAASALFGVALLAVLAVLADPVRALFRTETLWPLAVLALFVAALTYFQIVSGLLMGLQRFSAFAAASLVDALVRALVIAPLVSLFGVVGGLISYGIGTIGASALAIARAGGLGWQVRAVADKTEMVHIGLSSVLLTLTMAVLQHSDLVLLRTYAQPEEVGWYAAAAAVGTLVYTVTAPLYLTAYPRVLAARQDGQPTWPLLSVTLAAVVIIGGVAISGASVLGEPLANVLFGPSFLAAGLLMPVYLAKTTASTALFVLGQHAIAVGRGVAVTAALCPALLSVVLVAFLRPSPAGTALFLCVGALGAAGAAALTLSRSR